MSLSFLQQWSSILCDCTITGHSGSRCQQGNHYGRETGDTVDESHQKLFPAGTTYEFPSSPSAIIMEYADGARPSTKKVWICLDGVSKKFRQVVQNCHSQDLVVLSFKTHSSSGVLLAVQCTGATDFLTLYIVSYILN